jgi:hypothetical protein
MLKQYKGKPYETWITMKIRRFTILRDWPFINWEPIGQLVDIECLAAKKSAN